MCKKFLVLPVSVFTATPHGGLVFRSKVYHDGSNVQTRFNTKHESVQLNLQSKISPIETAAEMTQLFYCYTPHQNTNYQNVKVQ